ncbi:hypothetical protein NSK_005117 [Nannochloropsis salina CCMP1776]|uniref:Uncharacterized protein n=1 Tax=Nannochloropsis salina CCMP1776 TaxID=1027361 RepID=A0A4D9CXJ8_9STRA|nr:hypothetical protein NSK_005117 [Nannochloropsis salina CCMP1776]|eukprot:TFJ84022.1 hypothetical protein NSK_005117 [Nannochloropsis salina CCMP1776]
MAFAAWTGLHQNKVRVSELHDQAERYHARSIALDHELAQLRVQAERLSTEICALSGRIAQEHETRTQLIKEESALEQEHREKTQQLQNYEAAWKGRASEKQEMILRVAKAGRSWNRAVMTLEEKARLALKDPLGMPALRERLTRAWERKIAVEKQVEETTRLVAEARQRWAALWSDPEKPGIHGNQSPQDEEAEREEGDQGEEGQSRGESDSKEQELWRELAALQEEQRVLREQLMALDRETVGAEAPPEAETGAENQMLVQPEEENENKREENATNACKDDLSCGPEDPILRSPTIVRLEVRKETDDHDTSKNSEENPPEPVSETDAV